MVFSACSVCYAADTMEFKESKASKSQLVCIWAGPITDTILALALLAIGLTNLYYAYLPPAAGWLFIGAGAAFLFDRIFDQLGAHISYFCRMKVT